MTAIPKTWQEWRPDGTAIRRIGFLNGTWMDPEDAKPRRAKVWWQWTNENYIAWVGKPVHDCEQLWEGMIRTKEGYKRGIISVGLGGYEFTYENPEV